MLVGTLFLYNVSVSDKVTQHMPRDIEPQQKYKTMFSNKRCFPPHSVQRGIHIYIGVFHCFFFAMEAETRRKVEEMVLDILKKSNIEEATEFTIRVAASERLGIDLSDTASKHFVRSVVESFLLSVAANEKSKDAEKKKENEDIAAKNDDVAKKEDVVVANEEESRETEVLPKLKRDDPERVICHVISPSYSILNGVKALEHTCLVSLVLEFWN